MLHIAHRGASGAYPENTLLAFRKALELGATSFELDVQLAADGELMVIHDEMLERTTDGVGLVSDYPAHELRRLDAGCGERIPLLREVLELVTGKLLVNIELKGAATAGPTARLLNELLAEGRLKRENLLVSSFDQAELRCFSRAQTGVRLAAVFEHLPLAADLWEMVAGLGLWSIHFERSLLTAELVAAAQSRGVRVFAYTVNTQAERQRMRKLGVDGVFTDYPGLGG